MLRPLLILTLTISATLLCCCAARPVVTRRYRAQTPIANATIGVRLTAFSLDVPIVSTRTTLLNLADRGQASLIEEYGMKSTSARELLRNLEVPITFAQDAGRVVDHTLLARRVVFSIDHQTSGPADRVTEARIVLTLPAASARFENWTQFATKYETADLGSLKFTQNREVNVDVSGGAAVAKAEVQAKASNALEENLKLTQRYVSVTGGLAPRSAEIVQQGAPGIDVTGNIVVDFTIQIESTDETYTFEFGPLFDGAQKPTSPDAIVLTRQTVKFVSDASSDIVAKGALTATIRHVIRGDDTVMEGDDIVEFRSGAAKSIDVTLVPKEFLQFSVWELRDGRHRALQIETNPNQHEGLQLGSFYEALALREYLTRNPNPGSIAGCRLWLDQDTQLDKNNANGLQVSIEPRNWTPPQPKSVKP